MIQLRPGLWKMESSSSWGCNTYLFEQGGRVFLVDPGPGFQLKRMVRELGASGRSAEKVTDVLLTHYDQDHSRSAAEWQRRTGARVYLGAADAEILRSGRVPGSWQRRFMMRLLGLAELPEGTVELRGEVTVAPGLTALPSPGHTPGHYAYLWRDVAFIGDAANCGSDGELVPFDRPLMTDPAQGDAIREMLSALPVRLFCSGHSEAVERRASRPDPGVDHTPVDTPTDHTEEGRAPAERRSLAERFDTWAVMHPHAPVLRHALGMPTLLWRLGLGPALARVRTANGHLVMLTVTGRRSGAPRHAPVYLHEWRGETYLWCPYGGRAQWYRNVVADPVVTVQDTDRPRVMRAEPVEDPDHLMELVADLREFDETFLRSYLASEDIRDSQESIAAKTKRLHVRRLEPTDQPGPPPLSADLAWAWLVPLIAIALVASRGRLRHGGEPHPQHQARPESDRAVAQRSPILSSARPPQRSNTARPAQPSSRRTRSARSSASP